MGEPPRVRVRFTDDERRAPGPAAGVSAGRGPAARAGRHPMAGRPVPPGGAAADPGAPGLPSPPTAPVEAPPRAGRGPQRAEARPRPSGLLALVVRDGRHWDLALYDPELGAVRPLTGGGAVTPVTRPAPAPDGRLVAYFAADGTVRARPLVGRGERVLAAPGGPVAMAWSPDGRHLALDGVLVVDRAGGEARRLAEGGRWPQWLPDGSLVFARALRLWRLDPRRGEEEPLPAGPPAPRAALRASADGRYLAFASPEAPASRLYVLDLHGDGPPAAVDTLGRDETEPCWAPRLPLLAFAAAEPAAPEDAEPPPVRVRVADATGTVLRDLARLTAPLGTALAWSPDGRHLAALETLPTGRRLRLLPVDGRGEPRSLPDFDVAAVAWFAKPAALRQS